MSSSRHSLNSLIAVVSAVVSLFSYCLTSQILDAAPAQAICVGSLDLGTVASDTASPTSPDQWVSVTCERQATVEVEPTTAVSLRSLNP